MTTKPHPYRVKLTYTGAHKVWPKIKGKILENDVWIGEFSRGATERGYIPPIVYKFYSTAAQTRFNDWADCLSIPESIEALIPANKQPTQKSK